MIINRKSTNRLALVLLLLLSIHGASVSVADVIDINPDPSNAAGNCDAVIAAIARITSTSQNESHQVRLGPGRYLCNGKTIVMKEYVDLVGTGIETTLVEGSGLNDSLAAANVLIRGANHAEIRDMKIEMNNPSANSVGIFIYEAETRVDNVDILLFGGTADCKAIVTDAANPRAGAQPHRPTLRNSFFNAQKCINTYGLVIKGKTLPMVRRAYIMALNADKDLGQMNVALLFDGTDAIKNSNTIKMRDVEISAYGVTGDSATCYGIGFENVVRLWKIDLFNARVTADRCSDANIAVDIGNPSTSTHHLFFHESQLKAAKGVTASNDVGILADGNKVFVEMYGGEIHAQGPSIRVLNNASVKVGGLRLSGTGVDDANGTAVCAGVYDENFVFLTDSCPIN